MLNNLWTVSAVPLGCHIVLSSKDYHMYNAILIDPLNKSVETQNFIPSQICTLIDANLLDAVSLPSDHTLWIDDEGFLVEQNIGYFKLANYPNIFAGKGLITGYCPESGESISSTLNPEIIKKHVIWVSHDDAMKYIQNINCEIIQFASHEELDSHLKASFKFKDDSLSSLIG